MGVALAAAPALAAEPVSSPGYALGSQGGEVAVAAVSAASLGAWLLPQRATSWAPSTDRSAHLGYGIASDVVGATGGSLLLLTAGYFLETAYLESGSVDAPFARAGRVTLVEGESALLATGLTYAIKRLSGRCRPRSYRAGQCVGGEHDAFPSGHTSAVAAIAGASLVLSLRSTGDAGPRYAALGLAEGFTAAAATLRVLAGAHSWEDVVGGALLGHAAGVGVALLHPMERPATGAGGASAPMSGAAFVWGGGF
jgi:hypothetical protein